MSLSVFGGFFGTSHVGGHRFCRQRQFSLFLSVFIFSCLIALARTFGVMMRTREGMLALLLIFGESMALSPFTLSARGFCECVLFS